MTEAYTDLNNTIKFYHYGVNIPFNFYFITDVKNSSKPSDLKKVIENWMARVPPNDQANWVVRMNIELMKKLRLP